MADTTSQALTAANTSVKVVFELEKSLLDLLRVLIPDKSPLQELLEKEMEAGNVNVEMLKEENKNEIRTLLQKQGLKENQDFFIRTMHRVDGESYINLFYHIKDEKTILGEVGKLDPGGRANHECNEFYQALQKAGIEIDGTIDINKFEQFLKSEGVKINTSQPLSEDDKEMVEKLLRNSFADMSEGEKSVLLKKVAQSGVIENIVASQMAGNVSHDTLTKLAKGDRIYTMSGVGMEQMQTMEKRAEVYGLKFHGEPQGDGSFKVSFASKDEDVMKRVLADTKYDLYGPAGDIYKKQLQFENQYNIDVINSVNGNPPRFPDSTEIKDGSMLVGTQLEVIQDRNGNPVIGADGKQMEARQTLEISHKGMFMNKDIDGASQRAFGDNCKKLTQNFLGNGAVLLNPQQAQAYKNATSEKERLGILLVAKENAEHGIVQKPVFSKQDVEVIKEHEKLRNIVSKKLDAIQPSDGKMLAPLVALSPVVRYVNDQILNGEQRKDTNQYYRGGGNFINRGNMESLDIADALSEDERTYVDGAVDSIDSDLTNWEDTTESFIINNDMEQNILNDTLDIESLDANLDIGDAYGDLIENQQF